MDVGALIHSLCDFTEQVILDICQHAENMQTRIEADIFFKVWLRMHKKLCGNGKENTIILVSGGT